MPSRQRMTTCDEVADQRPERSSCCSKALRPTSVVVVVASIVVTDIQAIVGAITAVGATIAASIRWGTGKMARAQDRSVAALIKSAESNATLAARFESLTGRIETLAARFDRLVEVLLSSGGLSIAEIGAVTGPHEAATPNAVVVSGVRREESQRVATTVEPGRVVTKRIGKRRGTTGRGDSGET